MAIEIVGRPHHRKSVAPSVDEPAFDCPHCGAYTTQYWHALYARRHDEDDRPTPLIPTGEQDAVVQAAIDLAPERKQEMLAWSRKVRSGFVWVDDEQSSAPGRHDVGNLFISKCYVCGKFGVWVHQRLVDPPARTGVQPNHDLPDDIATDFNEARSIVDMSPRGAAALLRLAIQKLCTHLGERGKSIDDDIASLVKKGLNARVQKSLDIVRVIGNEAVHAGTLDLRDDRDTANALFVLVNAIADEMISHPKVVDELYGKLPQGKRDAIDRRDGRKTDES